MTYQYEEYDFDERMLFQQRISGVWSTVVTYNGTDNSGCVPSVTATVSPSATAIRWFQPQADPNDYIWLLSGLNLVVVETKGNVAGAVQVTNGPYPASASSPLYVVVVNGSGAIVASSPAITTPLQNGGNSYQISGVPEGGPYSVRVSTTSSGSPALPANWTSSPATGVSVVAAQTSSGVNVQLTGPDPNGDADGDGIKNGDEGGPSTDTDGDGKPDYLDKDSDNDGIPDSVEKGTGSTPVDTDGDSIPDYRDLDSDNDGINDVREGGGSATDTNNDGRADGTVDPTTGIPSSAGANGTTTPRDTDGDGKPDYRDLDSDNDGKSDLQENGNPAAIAGDADNDGVIDYSPANDPDKDGIMSPADGIPNTWGDASDPSPKNTGPNTTDAPDYINPKSDGTNNDINSTPYKNQDGNGDGKIDNTTDPDNDGIPNVIDTKPGNFGGLSAFDPNGDADGDGIKNGDEGGPSTDTDGDGKPDYLDKDSDNDGIPDSVEKGTGSTPVDTDGDSIPDYRDLDSDNDGINDVREGGGSATDTDNDGRADGTIDPTTGIPSSAGANGITTPRDTDGDGKPDYRDLDSDNDGKSDLQENGNPAAIAGDADNDGVIDYSPANDPDKDGIMSPADGIPNTWGDASDPAPKNTGPNTTDAPDYINPKSDGTTNDIIGTPNSGQDTDGDGKIDNPADADNDGVADVIDTKPGEFGGIGLVTPATPDLRPQINMTDVGFSSSATTKPLTVRIRNLRSGTTTTGPVTVRIYKPTPSSVITLTGASATAWTISSTPGYYLLTTNSPIAGLTNRDITASLTINPVTAGNFGLRVLIPNLAGGEALPDNGNNEASITIYGN
ncbi:hypothetical protein GCM10023091_06360 [Ravibacter arvi]|uniref:Uncharacterized protein n=1 Tax=Ravibacter arvi TaxID=2051041 RepID=A0ABP8LNP2_9BACT